jgi:2',3'-cyclic-nucleotide 2'-phosphodiesterase
VKPFRVLVGGDVVGKPGRTVCAQVISRLRRDEKIDFVIVNGENAAAGSGITEATTQELFQGGVDVITTGDHVFKKKEAEELLRREQRILRPANYPAIVPGEGSVVMETRGGVKVGVMNLQGRVFMKALECPFETAKREVEKMRKQTPLIIVDIHAEATSEKIALGWYLDGKVSAIFGTHTHIQTADECILPGGTGYITDVGMIGPYRSVLGRGVDGVLHMFLTQMPARFEMATEDLRFSGALFDLDPETGKTIAVRRVHERFAA